jgi:hypothetical protein
MKQCLQDFLPIAETKQHGNTPNHSNTHNGKNEIQIHGITLLCPTVGGEWQTQAAHLMPWSFLLFYFIMDLHK